MPNFLYPRTINVMRSKTNTAGTGGGPVGLIGYSGREDSLSPADAEGFTMLFSQIQADIQVLSPGGLKGMLPADAVAGSQWEVMTAANDTPQYSIRDRDHVVDDEGYRYIVLTAYWQGMGYSLKCTRLET